MRKAPILAFAIGCISSLVLFQNCTAPADIGGTDLKSQAADLPFAYDAKLNQIAYMSCSNMDANKYDKSAFFSYRAGAYDLRSVLGLPEDNGGLRLNSAYLDVVSRKSDDLRWGLLAESPANSSTVLQLGVRHLGDLQHIYTSSGSPARDLDFQNMLEELGPTGVSKALIELPDNQRMRYLTNGDVKGSRMEASIYFGDSEDLAKGIRDALNGDTFALGITYTDMKASSTNETAARSEATVWPDKSTVNINRDVYGRGYHLRFSKMANTWTGYPVNVLQSVAEQDFHTLTDRQGTWDCSSLRFRIIRAADAPTVGCARKPDPAIPSQKLKIVRNVLKYEDWYVDMDNMCIVPKRDSTSQEDGCYGANRYIQYDLSKECTPNPATNNAVVEANKACLAFASICYRTN